MPASGLMHRCPVKSDTNIPIKPEGGPLVSRVVARLLSSVRRARRRPALALALLAAVALGIGALPVTSVAKPGPDGFADLAAKLLPAVVNISSTQTLKPGQDSSDDSDGPAPGGKVAATIAAAGNRH